MTVRDAALFLILKACEQFGSTGFQPVIFLTENTGWKPVLQKIHKLWVLYPPARNWARLLFSG
jgi:hypothetical protein